MYRRFGKRLFDITLCMALMPAALPAMLVTAVALALAQRGAVFFVQVRPGLRERPFRLVKFKTMTDARNERGDLLADGDRLTPVGRLVRALSLDELPQLWNVLRGDMSIVGPRPLLMEYLPLYSPAQSRRHEVRPGITGLAQVRGRNLLSWEDRFRLDVAYVDTLSWVLDLKILCETVAAVLSRRGISAAGQATIEPFRGNERSLHMVNGAVMSLSAHAPGAAHSTYREEALK